MGCIPHGRKEILVENKSLQKSPIKSDVKSISVFGKKKTTISKKLSSEKSNIENIDNNIDNNIKYNQNQNNSFYKKIKIERGLFVQGFSGDPLDKYEIINSLGEGSYGKVYKVKVKNSEIYRAMKVIKKRYQYNTQEEEKIIKEIQILRKLDHPNIIKVFEFYNTKVEFYIISELCTGGELFDRIIKLKKLNEKVAANVMKQLLSAILFCHKNQVIHRDLKPENILIESQDNQGEHQENNFFTIKVIDYGTAEIFKNNTLLHKQIGTPYYIAPEVLNNQYNEKCDLWSCGVILYILLCGCPPFYGKNDNAIFESVRSGKFSFKQPIWNSVSEEAKNLIRILLDLDYDKRPSAENAIKHPWFAKAQAASSRRVSETYDTDSESVFGRKPRLLTKNSTIKSSINGLKEVLFNLKNFRAERKLQQATLYFMVQQLLSSEEVKEIRAIFLQFDENQDGRLTKEEVLKGFKMSKFCLCSQDEIEKIMDLVDIDGNGFIEYQEFISATFSKKKILTEDNLKRAFDMFDKDKSGKISSEELKIVLGGNNEENEEVWKRLISDIDLNGDGEISFYEFKEMMYNLVSSA